MTLQQVVPTHQDFSSWVLERRCTPLAFDYHLDQETVVIP